MNPENLKLLFRSYIQCKQNQDECDGPVNLAVECDDPVRPHPFGGEYPTVVYHGQSGEASPGTLMHLLSFEQAPNLPNNIIQAGRDLARMAHEFSFAQPDKSIIKFKDICMVVEPGKQIISVPVLRDPNFSQNVTKVSWKTCDKTALTGINYVGSCGELIFKQGELSKDIKIQILNSDDSKADDSRFTVELNYDGVYNPKPMTVSLKKINHFYSDEMTVLRNFPRSLPFTIFDIKCALEDCLTKRTFHMALTHLCSTNNATDVKIALAFELSSLFLCKLRGDTILNVLTDFFRMDNFDF